MRIDHNTVHGKVGIVCYVNTAFCIVLNKKLSIGNPQFGKSGGAG